MDGKSMAAKALVTAIQIDHHNSDSITTSAKPVELREFFWDKIISAMIVLVFGATSIQTIASYFNSEVLTCLLAENYTQSVQAYINQLCTEELPSYGKNFKIILYAQFVALSALQIFWTQVWSGYVDTFKSAIGSMSLKRDRKNGRFPQSDFVIARYLENNFKGYALMWTYITKIAGQIVVSIIGIFLTFYDGLEFDEILTFTCNSSVFPNWPLSEPDIQCTHYEELHNLQILRWLNFSVQMVVFGANFCGVSMLASSIYFYNVNIGYKRVAEFVLRTGIRREYYPQYHGQSLKTSSDVLASLFNLKRYSNFQVSLPDEELKIFEEEQRQLDMMFLIRRLIATNSKQGGAFLDVLIDNYLDFLCENRCGEWYRCYHREKKTENHQQGKKPKNNQQGKKPKNNQQGKKPEKQSAKNGESGTERVYDDIGELAESIINSNGAKDYNAILVTDQNETLAFLLNRFQDLFKKVICINFNADISPSHLEEDSDSESGNDKGWPWPEIVHVPSHLWSIHLNSSTTAVYLRKIKSAIATLKSEPETIVIFGPISTEVYGYQQIAQRVHNLLQQIKESTVLVKILLLCPQEIARQSVVNKFFRMKDSTKEEEEDGTKNPPTVIERMIEADWVKCKEPKLPPTKVTNVIYEIYCYKTCYSWI